MIHTSGSSSLLGFSKDNCIPSFEYIYICSCLQLNSHADNVFAMTDRCSLLSRWKIDLAFNKITEEIISDVKRMTKYPSWWVPTERRRVRFVFVKFNRAINCFWIFFMDNNLVYCLYSLAFTLMYVCSIINGMLDRCVYVARFISLQNNVIDIFLLSKWHLHPHNSMMQIFVIKKSVDCMRSRKKITMKISYYYILETKSHDHS